MQSVSKSDASAEKPIANGEALINRFGMSRHNTMFGKVVLLFTTMGLAGCATPVPMVQMTDPPPPAFDQVAWVNQPGTGVITGQGFETTRGGDVKTCAGRSVYALPTNAHQQGAFADQAVLDLAMVDVLNTEGLDYEGFDAPVITSMPQLRTTSCDAQGNFEFDNMPAGAWTLATSVAWQVPVYSALYNVVTPEWQTGEPDLLATARNGETVKATRTGG